jgi:hypothetical protein
MVTEPMTVPERRVPESHPEPTHRPWRWAWFVGLSAVALLVVAGLAAVLTADDDGAVSPEDAAAAIAVVTVHNEAQNAGDGEMMRATLTEDAAFVIDEQFPGMTVDEYIGVVEGYGPVVQTFTGEPSVARDSTGIGELRVSVPMSFDSSQGQDNSWNGTSVYTLREVDGEWKIAQIDRLSGE